MSGVASARRGVTAGLGVLVALMTVAAVPPAAADISGVDELVVDVPYEPVFLDTYFDAPAQVADLIKSRDGKVLAGGRFNEVDGEVRTGVVRLLADGTVDPSFAPAGVGLVPPAADSLAVQRDGKILVGGEFDSFDGEPIGDIVRLNTDGTLDRSFVPDELGNRINALAVQRDGKILAGVARGTVVRLNADGSLDDSYETTMTPQVGVFEIVPQPEGDLLIAGAWDFLNGEEWRFGLARLNSDGSTDLAFDPRGDVTSGFLADIDVARNGEIVVGGVLNVAGDERYLGAFSPSGSLLGGMGTRAQPDSTVISVIRQPNGKVVIGGFFEAVGDTARGNVARLRPNGSLDRTDVGSGAEDGQVWSMLRLRGGRVLVGGDFTTFDGYDRFGLVQLVRDAA